jgi:fatty-acyl-CoA synthase
LTATGADLARARARQLLLPELVRRWAVSAPTLPALRFGDRVQTYGDLDARAGRLAAALREREVRQGDCVGLWMHNGIEMVEALFAIHRLGAVAVPLNFRLTGPEAAFIIRDAGARGWIGDQALLDSARGSATVDWELAVTREGDGSYMDAILAHADPFPPALVADDDPAFVMYTSGTTGWPKGATLSHKNVVTNTWNWTFAVEIRRGDVYTAGLPLFHIGGLVGLYPFLMLGNCCVLQPTGGFDPDAALDLMVRAGTTVCAYVPAQWQLIVERPRAAQRLAGQRRAIWGASPASRPLLERMVESLAPDSVLGTFGQTEVTANATFLQPRDALRKLGSVGRPALTMEYRIVDPADHDVPEGEVGEIVYRGPTVMSGYWGRADATKEAFRGGWFHSGDLVRSDDEGYVYVVDRRSDLIVSGGENIYPAEVERVLAEHAAVAEVAVVGVTDPRWGETPVAYVVPSRDHVVHEDELLAFCAPRLARYKHPSRFVVIDALPRNAGGKVLKRELRERRSDDLEVRR